MSTPFYQQLDPATVPSPVTPSQAVTESKGGIGYADIPPPGYGPAPAPYDISGPQDIAGITAAVSGAGAISGAGIVYPQGPRQSETAAILYSPQGAESSNVFAGFPDYENQDLRPGANMETPIQGHTSDYPGTTQPGVPQFMAGLGGAALPGVPPKAGSLGPGGGDYPGTTQDGLTKYGTS